MAHLNEPKNDKAQMTQRRRGILNVECCFPFGVLVLGRAGAMDAQERIRAKGERVKDKGQKRRER